MYFHKFMLVVVVVLYLVVLVWCCLGPALHNSYRPLSVREVGHPKILFGAAHECARRALTTPNHIRRIASQAPAHPTNIRGCRSLWTPPPTKKQKQNKTIKKPVQHHDQDIWSNFLFFPSKKHALCENIKIMVFHRNQASGPF